MKSKPKLIVFASGGKTGGGSGFGNLVKQAGKGVLDAEIVAVVSSHARGGVYQYAQQLGIPFHFMPKPYQAEAYQKIVKQFGAQWIALSGWLKLALGLPANRTLNIHPGPLPEYGGPGLYGHYVHEAVLRDFKAGKITHSAVSMHFVTPEYDEGPIFFYYPVPIRKQDTPESLAKRVNRAEHQWQPYITNLVVNQEIWLAGMNVKVPTGYKFLKK